MPDKPLGLPIGSVRATLAILSLIALIIVSAMQIETATSILKDVVLIIIGFYFGSRRYENGKDGTNR